MQQKQLMLLNSKRINKLMLELLLHNKLKIKTQLFQRFSFENKIIPVTNINIQLTRRIIDAQIPPKTFVCQKSVRIFNISVKRIT